MTLAHVVFLMHFRSILIVTLPLPLAVLVSFLGMYYAGISSNIMSLAGIAIAIGVLSMPASWSPRTRSGSSSNEGSTPAIAAASGKPVRDSTRSSGGRVLFDGDHPARLHSGLALTGQEGKLFHPLAFTKTFAVLAATVIESRSSLCSACCSGGSSIRRSQPRHAVRPGQSTGRSSEGRSRIGADDRRSPLLSSGPGPGASDRERIHAAAQRGRLDVHAHRRSQHLAEEEHAGSRPARTPPDEVSGGRLRRRQGRAGRHLDRPGAAEHDRDDRPLEAEARVAVWNDARWAARRNGAAVQLPGVSNIWTMPIINRIDMLTTGIRSEVGVKIFGTDLTVLEELARKMADTVRRVPGASNVYPNRSPVVSTSTRDRRGAAARYGIGVGDIQQVIETAVGETTLTTTIEGRQRFPVRVRLCARIPRRSSGARSSPRGLVQWRADPAQPSRSDRARSGSRDDFFRERPVARDGPPERAEP